ncbi:unnamed protein product, partial [Rotaria magnacalcarata]
ADSNGNNILHLLVIHKLPKIYTKVKQRWLEIQADENFSSDEENAENAVTKENKVIPLWKRLNKDGFTPLTLAAKLGQIEMFSFLLEERKITQWSFGPVACVLYPLDQVDLEINQEDDDDKPVGALEIIVQNAHVELIMHPRLIDLVNKKWERFARRIFFRRFLVTLLYLLTFLLTTILDQSRVETLKRYHEGCTYMKAQSAVLALAAIIGWGYMLFFVMAFRLTGPFVVMIYEMLFNDVLRFFIIYAVFLVGFSQAFFVLFDNNGFSGFLLSVKQSFLGMLGDFDLDAYTETNYRYVSVILLIVYIIVVTILLLNLLIAMMGDTYGNVIEGATQIWHLERARIVFAIENEMSGEERNLDTNKYWTNIDGERYLQVEEVDDASFLHDDTEEEDANDDADSKKDDRTKRLGSLVTEI